MNEKPYNITDRDPLVALSMELKRRFEDGVNGMLVLWTEEGFNVVGWTHEGTTISPASAASLAARFVASQTPEFIPDPPKG